MVVSAGSNHHDQVSAGSPQSMWRSMLTWQLVADRIGTITFLLTPNVLAGLNRLDPKNTVPHSLLIRY
jgi:hypothetical protein